MFTNSAFDRKYRLAPRLGVLVATALIGASVSVGSAAAGVTGPADPLGTNPTSTGTLGPSALGGPITRAQIIARADDWMNQVVMYSTAQGPDGTGPDWNYWSDSATGGPYRQDCSGFVSMAWGLSSSLVTPTLPNVATVTDANITDDTNLNPGDALDYTADHVVLFDHWTDNAGHFAYDAEHAQGQPTNQSTGSIYASDLEGYPISDFEALRYDNLSTAPESTVQDLAAFSTGNGSLYSMTDEGGTLYEVIQNMTTGTWSNTSPGIKVSGGLTSWYDAAKDSTYTMADEGGTLYEVIQNMTTGTWSNTSPGISVSGQLSSFVTGNGSLYTMADENGELFEVIQNLTTGTWLNNDTGIKVSGGISTWYDSANDSTYIMADEGGTLYEVIQNMTTGTWSNNSPGIAVSGELSTFSTGNGSLYTIADENGTLYEVIQNLTTGTWLNNSPAIAVSGGVSAWYDAANSSTYVMADEGGTLHEVIQNMTTGTWSNNSPGIAVN